MRNWPLTADEIAQVCELRYIDGLTIPKTAEQLGLCEWTVRKYAPGRPGKVPVAPLRKAFLASPMTAGDVARELGWWNRAINRPDSSRVRHTLGLIVDNNGAGRRSYRTVTDAETVRLIAEAIGISPWSVLPDDEDVAA